MDLLRSAGTQVCCGALKQVLMNHVESRHHLADVFRVCLPLADVPYPFSACFELWISERIILGLKSCELLELLCHNCGKMSGERAVRLSVLSTLMRCGFYMTLFFFSPLIKRYM